MSIAKGVEEEYWLVPRSKLEIRKVLKTVGYIIDSSGYTESNGKIAGGITHPDFPSLYLGQISTDDEITMEYTASLSRFHLYLDLRDFLLKNKVKFQESPTLKETLEQFKGQKQLLDTIVSGLER